MFEIRRARRGKGFSKTCFFVSWCYLRPNAGIESGWQGERLKETAFLNSELEKERELALSSKIKFATEKISICPVNEAVPGSEECLFCCPSCISYYLEEFFGCDGFLLCWYRRNKK